MIGAGRLGKEARILYLEGLVAQGAPPALSCWPGRCWVLSRGSAPRGGAGCASGLHLTERALPGIVHGRCRAGRAAWLDKEKGRCLILWKTVPEWAEAVGSWVQSCGHQDSVFSLEDLSSGDDVQGTGGIAAFWPASALKTAAPWIPNVGQAAFRV